MKDAKLALIFVSLAILASCVVAKKYYVATDASCGFYCTGDDDGSPFPNLRRAVKAIQQSSSRPPPFQDIDYEVYVGPGTYFGGENIALMMNARAVAITSTHGSSQTVIDCLGEGRFLTLTNASLALTGFTIRNCAHLERGGAVLSLSSTVTMEDVVFENNTANQGGAVFGSGGSFKLISCRLENNKALDRGGALYLNKTRIELQSSVVACNEQQSNTDIYCKLNTTGSIDFASSVSQAGFGCEPSAGCSFIFDTDQLCGRNATCSQRQAPPPVVVIEEPDNTNATWTLDPDRNQISIPDAKQYATCNDSVCSLQYETCLTCPQDCQQCQFSGIKLSSYVCEPQRINETDCLYRVTSRPTPDIVNFMKGVQGPVTGIASGYFTVPDTSFYSFTLEAINVGARVFVDRLPIVDSYFQQNVIRSSNKVLLKTSETHSVVIQFFSYSNGVRNVSLKMSSSTGSQWLFLSPTGVVPGEMSEGRLPVCGDGICQELPSSCFVDCHESITPECSSQAPAPGQINDLNFLQNDTFGNILELQYLPRLPGVEHMMNGFDILTGEQKVSFLFYFGFCNGADLHVVQDTYRGVMYTVPEELYGQFYSQCSYDIQTSSYSSSQELSQSYASDSTMSVNVGANGGIPGLFNIAAEFAFSQETSVKNARELETKRTGSLLKAEVYCLTSKVQMNKFSFHPIFLKDLSQVQTIEGAVRLVEKYGTHYYRSATLGGKLTQITAVDSSFARTKTESELSQSAQLSFHASVSSPVFSAQGSYDQSLDTDITSSEQSTFEEQSSRTRVFTYGGAPGSFGPSNSPDTPSNYGEWAASVDLLPVPVNYELDLIARIIPEAWKVNNTSVHELWINATAVYLKTRGISVLGDKVAQYILELAYEPSDVDEILSSTGHTISLVVFNNKTKVIDTLLVDNAYPLNAPFSFKGFLDSSGNWPQLHKVNFTIEGPVLKSNETNLLIGLQFEPSDLNRLLSPKLKLWSTTNSAQYYVDMTKNPATTLEDVQVWRPVNGAPGIDIQFTVENIDYWPTYTYYYIGRVPKSQGSFNVEVKIVGTLGIATKWFKLEGDWPDTQNREALVNYHIDEADYSAIGTPLQIVLKTGGARRHASTPYASYYIDIDAFRLINSSFPGWVVDLAMDDVRERLVVFTNTGKEDYECYYIPNLDDYPYQKSEALQNPTFKLSDISLVQNNADSSIVFFPDVTDAVSIAMRNPNATVLPLVKLQQYSLQ